MHMFSSKVVLVISRHDTVGLLIRVQVFVLLAAFALRACARARDNINVVRALDKVVDTEDVADNIELRLQIDVFSVHAFGCSITAIVELSVKTGIERRGKEREGQNTQTRTQRRDCAK